MNRRKVPPYQPPLPIIPIGPAELAIASAKMQAKPAVMSPAKLPSDAEVTAMASRFRSYAQSLRDLLADLQLIVAEKWPIADEDYDGNLVEHINNMLHPIDVDTTDVSMLQVDITIATLLADVDTIADDLSPGKEQGEWIKAILKAEAVPPAKPTKRTKS